MGRTIPNSISQMLAGRDLALNDRLDRRAATRDGRYGPRQGPHWAEHDAVVDAAWMAAGLVDVHDELSVTG